MKTKAFYLLRFWLLPLLLLASVLQVSAQCTAPTITSGPTKGDTVVTYIDRTQCTKHYTFNFNSSGTQFILYTITMTGATSATETSSGYFRTQYNIGVTKLRVVATNSCGSDTLTFYLKVADTLGPIIYGPSSITLTHNNGCSVNASSVLSYFTALDNCGYSSVSISPSIINIGSANYTATSVDPRGNVSTRNVSINLLSPEINVFNGSNSIADNDTIPSTTNGTDFGIVQPYTPYTKSFTVKNTGTDTLSVGNISLANQTGGGGFSIMSTAFPRKLAPGESGGIAIKFLTSASSVNPTADVVIQNNDCDESTYNFRLAANVVCPAVSLTAPTDTVFRNTTSGTCKATYRINVSAGSSLPIDYYQYVLSGATNASFNSFYFFNDEFNIGITKVQVRAYNICGSYDEKIFYVKVTDNIAPYIYLSPATLNVGAGCTASTNGLSLDYVHDACGVASTSNDAPANLPVGTWTVKWTAIDINGNTSTANQTVTVVDGIKPTITPPAAITVNVDNGSCSTTSVSLGTPTTADNCGVDSVWNDAPLSFLIGITTVTWTVKDVNGNTNTATQDVTVVDNQNPIVTVADTVTYYLSNGCTVAANLLNLNQATDNCGIDIISNNAPAAFSAGYTPVTITAKDLHGNTGTKNVIVRVLTNDIEVSGNMIIINKGDATPTASDNTDFGTIAYQASTTRTFTITNIGDADLHIDSISLINNSNNTFSIVSSPAGNKLSSGQSANVTVKYNGVKGGVNTATLIINNSSCNNSNYGFVISGVTSCPPMLFQTPQTVFVNNDPGVCGASRTWTVTLNSSLPTTLSYAFTGATTASGTGTGSGSLFNIGTTNIFITATNSCESVTKLSAISVLENEKPVIIAPYDAIASADIGSCYASNVSLGIPIVSDNCGVDTFWNNAPAMYPVGITTVTWTVRDIYGKTSTATQKVHVSSFQPPVITAPSAVSVSADNGNCSATNVSLGTPNASSVCGIDTIWNNAPSVFPVGNTTVTWTAKDVNGTTATATQTVTVVDNQKPDITAPIDVTAYANFGQCYASGVALDVPTTGDNCGILSTTNNGLSTYPVGVTTVTWTVTDIHGNTNTAIQKVTVIDNQNPTITSPASITVNADSGNCSATNLALGTPITGDNCAVDSVYNDAPTSFPVGTTIVTWTVKDVNGNTAIATQNVTVIDNQAPVIVAPTSVTVNVDNGLCSASNVTLGNPIVSDNCAIDSIWNNAPNNYPVGTTTVTWTITDIHGNSNTGTQTVTVIDNELPTITCPANMTVNADSGMCTTTNVSLGTPTTSDNCGVDSIWNNAPSSYPVGTTTITWTVTDIHGNSTTCTQDVTVIDNQNPTITAPSALTINADDGTCAATNVMLGTATTNDNCGVDSVWNNAPSNYPVGTTTVTWKVIDVHGNSNTATQTVTVVDNQDPIAICKNYTATLSGGVTTVNASDINNGSTDNCGIDTMILSKTTFTCADAGTQQVVLTVYDIHGNSSSCTATVTIPAAPSVSITTTPSNNTYTGGNPNRLFLGYGPQSATISATGTGGNNFSYSWSPATDLSCSNCQSPIFTPTTSGNYNYIVTVINEGGCSATSSVSFCVLDVREYKHNGNLSGKIYVCVPKKNGQQTKAVQPSKVQGHLQNGGRLGKCEQSCNSASKGENAEGTQGEENGNISLSKLAETNQLKVYPNPNMGSFKVVMPSAAWTGSIIIRDMMGKEVKRITADGVTEITLNMTEVADGVYILEMMNKTESYRTRVIIKR